jgi:arsenite-transporting ATPase
MDQRILLFTGKGGVGKTTCAAATAIMAARTGIKTLVMSSDPAHSLADALNKELGPEPMEVAENLWAQEIDLYYSMKKYWGNIRELLLLVFKWQGINEIAAEELAAIPGMEEASALLWLDQFYATKEFDLIIVDSAPTGETLTFLTLPQVTEWWITKAFPFQKQAIETVGFALRKTTGVPLDKGYKELQELTEKLKFIQKVLSDPEVSSIRLVMNPERMVLNETKRAFTYLQMYGYNVDAIIVNRIIDSADNLSADWSTYITNQKKYEREIQDSFGDLPILKVNHQKQEVFGIELLTSIAESLYAERKPEDIFHKKNTFEIVQDGEDYVLTMRISFLSDHSFQLNKFGDQLVMQLKNQRLNYFLPKFLSYYEIKSSDVTEEVLNIRFVKGRTSQF